MMPAVLLRLLLRRHPCTAKLHRYAQLPVTIIVMNRMHVYQARTRGTVQRQATRAEVILSARTPTMENVMRSPTVQREAIQWTAVMLGCRARRT